MKEEYLILQDLREDVLVKHSSSTEKRIGT
jgi:hypothetical protein